MVIVERLAVTGVMGFHKNHTKSQKSNHIFPSEGNFDIDAGDGGNPQNLNNFNKKHKKSYRTYS